MQKKFEAILDEQLLPDAGAVLVAVSGGPDSMCLADLFLHSGYPFAVAHCNFRLRGSESDADEALVRQWCKDTHVPCHVKAFDTAEYARKKSHSIEMAARSLRYRWFGELCEENGYQGVAVAHNAMDNAETLILNLLRGTGLRGLGGMAVLGNLPDPKYSYVSLLRPLLSFTREEIEAHNKEFSVPSRLDATNLESDYKRNKIRNLVFPVFKEINPSFLEVFSRDMTHFAQAELALDYWYAAHESMVAERRGEVTYIPISSLSRLRWRDYFIYRALSGAGFNSTVTAAVTQMIDRGIVPSGKVFKAEEFDLITTSSSLIIAPRQENEEQSVIVPGPGKYSLGEDTFEVDELANEPDLPLKEQGTTWLDAEQMTFPFIVRRPLPGDWIVPIGLGGRKKLSNLFVDLKFSLYDKSRALVIVPFPGGSRISALAGWRVEDKMKVTPLSLNVFKITIL